MYTRQTDSTMTTTVSAMVRGFSVPSTTLTGSSQESMARVEPQVGIRLPRVRTTLHHAPAPATLLLRRRRQVSLNRLELLQCRPQVLRDLCRDHVRIGEASGVLQALVLEPKDIEACLVTLD